MQLANFGMGVRMDEYSARRVSWAGEAAGEWCGASSLNSLIAGSVAGSAVEGCTEELVLLVRRCNCSPNRLVDNLLVCTCFS